METDNAAWRYRFSQAVRHGGQERVVHPRTRAVREHIASASVHRASQHAETVFGFRNSDRLRLRNGASIETNLRRRRPNAPLFATCLVLLVLSLASPATHAQYPDKTITLVVPFPPGGRRDTVARPVAEAMSAS